MKRSVFSNLKLSGQPMPEALDQRLFGPTPTRLDEGIPLRPHQPSPPATSPANNTGTNQRAHPTTRPRANATTERPTNARQNGANRVAPLRGAYRTAGAHTAERRVERHSHDIFQDQIRWMNRLKLDLEEQTGTKITGNSMVQLAIDLFRDDFERHGEDSHLMRVLVHGLNWRPPGHESEDADGQPAEGAM